MKLYRTFHKERLTEIAKNADNKQIVKDVNYAAFLAYHGAKNLYCEWFDSAFIIGQYQKDCFRIIGLCTTVEVRGKGYAKFLLKRAEEAAKRGGLNLIRTVSLSGADFYVKHGFDVTGIKHGDYILEKKLS